MSGMKVFLGSEKPLPPPPPAQVVAPVFINPNKPLNRTEVATWPGEWALAILVILFLALVLNWHKLEAYQQRIRDLEKETKEQKDRLDSLIYTLERRR